MPNLARPARRSILAFAVVVLGLLWVASSASAAEPPNQRDPCSTGGRDTCGTTGVGSYERYRYGLRWFGDYRGAVPGAGPTFCIDLRFWYPDRDYEFEQIANEGLRNTEGAGVSIDKLIQESAGDTGAAPVAIMTHPCPRASVEKALAKVAELKITTDTPRLLRIESRA